MKFSTSDLVIVEGESAPCRVVGATPDCDGDIVVTRQGAPFKGRRYVPERQCKPYEVASVGVAVSHEAPQIYVDQAVPVQVQCDPSILNLSQTANQEKVSTMTNANRTLVAVSLIDQDAGLDVTKSLVKSFGQRMLEGSEENLKQEILMSENVESVLRAHNLVREKEVDLDILKRTGNKVMLQPVKIGDLTWVISRA